MLGCSHVLAAALEAVMLTPTITKIGFAAGGDLGGIARGYPALQCCARALPVVDVRDQEARRRAQRGGLSKKQAQQGLSLSSLAEQYLGRPINKALQVSDWTRRPLSAAQEQYAALDAWVPLRVHEVMTEAT
mmetsp:Transcript_9231/g.27317  ORF Transcript_9231/g.27317 Transcript_9231/m.27317 type:complete len:132 (+) Transcript_9231:127-522(+)